MNQDVSYPITPTAIKNGYNGYTDIALTNIFASAVSIKNSERAVIWQRWTGLLFTNTLIVAFMKDSGLNSWFISTIGLLLCLSWIVISLIGWNIYKEYLLYASKFRWNEKLENGQTLENPVLLTGITYLGEASANRSKSVFHQDWIKFFACYFVPSLFILIYIHSIYVHISCRYMNFFS